MRALTAIAAAMVAMVGMGGCQTLRSRGKEGDAGATPRATARARGAVLYAGYCAGCHGPDGQGDGPVGRAIGLRPVNLSSPGALGSASDEAVVERLRNGKPLRTHAWGSSVAEDLQVAALIAYVPTLSTRDWPLLRSGRLVYEGACGPCHGAYGNGEGVLAGLAGQRPADLTIARERYTDGALAQVSQHGIGAMAPMSDVFEPGEVRALIAYVRLLSKGYRIYDTYCAGCHGDDGRGVHPEDLLPPPTSAPPLHSQTLAGLTPEEERARVLHMLRREQGMMPHFQDTLSDRQLRDIVAYLRSQR